VFGSGPFDYLAANPEAGTASDARMAAIPAKREALLSQFDFASIRTIVDLGGGRGAILAPIVRTHPNLRGILFDLPGVMPEAETYRREPGVLDRCRLLGGSVLDSVPGGGDAYLTSTGIHTFDERQAVRVLRNIRRAIPGKGTLLLWKFAVPLGGEPSRSKRLDRRMLYVSAGVERTEAE
jgi:hypothetical protein